MKILVIIPTYNESENIENAISSIKNIDSNYDILIVDDNSPDKTYEIVDKLKQTTDNLYILKRKNKSGLGTAYCSGFKWAIEHNYRYVVQIDADLSHNPNDIPRLIEAMKSSHLVIGSRYISGINVVNWPLSRLILSYGANIYSKIITGLPVKDSTGGFKCFSIDVLKSIDLDSIKSTGYSFQIEMNFISWIKGFKLCEIPIVFTDRQIGKSKMSKSIIMEAIYMVPLLRIKRLLRIIK